MKATKADEFSGVYWLECAMDDVPQDNTWLTSKERAHLDSLHVEKRRNDWRLGRWTAKCAVCRLHELIGAPCGSLDVEIEVAASGAPSIRDSDLQISLSHRSGKGLCVLSRYRPLGCDLELIEHRSKEFVSDCLNESERSFLGRFQAEQSTLVALLWSAKESALKALQLGLRVDTRYVVVSFPESSTSLSFSRGDLTIPGWYPVTVTLRGSYRLQGWWSRTGMSVRTIISGSSERPVQLSAYVDNTASH